MKRALKTDPANVYMRKYRRARLSRGGAGARYCPTVPCEICQAPDARQPDHARGCPTLAPLPHAELLRLARLVDESWAADARTAKGASA